MRRARRGLRSAFFLGVWCVLGVVGVARAAEPPQAMSTHEQAARALYRQIGGAGVEKVRDQILRGVRERPVVAPLEDVFRGWYDGVISRWDREGEMAQFYMAAFSEQELRDLLAFYRTPAGKKMIEKLPELVRKEAQRSESFSDEHRPELEILLAARRKGLTQEKAAPPPP
jgi:hypothetical protein